MSDNFYKAYFKLIAGDKGYLEKEECIKALEVQGYDKITADKAFLKADTSKDGKVQISELIHHMDWATDGVIEKKKNAAKVLCKSLDKNGDGKFDKQEMKQVLSKAFGYDMDDEMVQMYFDIYDEGETGFIPYDLVIEKVFNVTASNAMYQD